jgi:nucleotide-binding universal stress UspA family protein
MRYLVALDGSPEALAGLEWVATLPLSAGDEVVLVSVVEPDATLERRARRLQHRDLGLLLDEAWRARREAARCLLDEAGAGTSGWTTPVRQVVMEGHPVAELARLAREMDVDLVVVGPRGRGRVAARMLGSVTRSLLGVLDRPLLVARRPVVLPDPIVVAVDGSAHGDAVIACVSSLAWTRRAAVVVVVVAGGPRPGIARITSRVLADAERALARRIADDAVAVLAASGRSATVALGSGAPSAAITAIAREHGAGLVALGARGAGGFRGLLVGSVAERVLTTAPCPVLAVPAAGRRAR